MNKRIQIAIPKWTELAILGENRLVKSSYIWLIIVPITAKLIRELPYPLYVNMGNENFQFKLSLPFSWQLFFFAALSFSIANVIFSFYRPLFTKFKDYGDFKNQGRTSKFLQSCLLKLRHSNSINLDYKLAKLYKFHRGDLTKLPLQIENDDNVQFWYDQVFREIRNMDGTHINEKTNANALAGIFWIVFKAENMSKKVARSCCFFFYGIGLIAMLYVMAQNIYFVGCESFQNACN